jgi:hypothetical protein
LDQDLALVLGPQRQAVLLVGSDGLVPRLGLGALGVVGARLGGAPVLRAGVRVLVGGALAMLVTGLIGRLTGVALD